ncbi:FliM/FliN family flagellar motor switch protein [Lichenifustis flavocetrariae]|uniref:Flagellar motor switch protein FliM n=1 Tax=Lichenifustis flavocetrariae TaxID=2949735 RepID=A0AA42CLI7_9HYPH|nr:FliM/FliN family flagellar motor switch protein [Lichenifustis flavocetrariae]MCW6507355.1 FliM/FliN family flagellar motor switch protein [Lichenifustis flavocetrariae]
MPSSASSRWFEKSGGSAADKIPAFRDAMADVAKAWQDRFAALASVEGEIAVEDVTVCKVDEILDRRGTGSVLAVLQAPGWNTRIGINFDRIFVTTMVEAWFGGGGEDVADSADLPLSPVDLQIVDVVIRQLSDSLTAGFAKRLPSSFRSEGMQAKFDPSFLGKPVSTVVVGTLALATLGGRVHVDVLVPLAAMLVFAEELAEPEDDERVYGDPRWTQRLETEVSRASMYLTAYLDLHPMTLGFIAALQEGQLIELPKGAGQRIRLQCGDDDLFLCDLGQSEGFYTLRVDEVLGVVEPVPEPEPVPELEL